MGIQSYSQNFEDVRLWRAFSEFESGRYIDIGAQDPVRDSVSFAFYQRGWRGVHVEPTPAYAAALRSARPDELVVEAAVSTNPGPIRLFEIPGTGLSTGIADIAERHAKDGWPRQTIVVPTVTLASLFDLLGEDPIHWLKIDVEGMEGDVLQSWGDHPARPAALVIEATAPNTQIQTHGPWHDLVARRGYAEVLFDGLSRYFIHESHAHRGEALAMSPNVFDGFAVSDTHFSAGQLVAEREARLEAARSSAEAERQVLVDKSAAELAAARAEADAALALAQARTEAMMDLAKSEVRNAEAETRRLQTLLEAQMEAHATLLESHVARFADGESVRRDLASRLTRAEEALTGAQAKAAALRDEIHSLALDHLKAMAKADASIAELLGRTKALDAETAALSQRLAESEAARESALRQVEDLRQANERRAVAIEAEREVERESALRQVEDLRRETDEQIATLQAETERLHAHIAWREGQLVRAARLLAEMPDPLAGWPRLLASFLARLAGRRPGQIEGKYQAAVANWQAGALLPDATGPSTIEQPPAANQSSSVQLNTNRDVDMLASEGPVTTVPRLLAPHDAAFIQLAYVSVLGRAPDAEGAAYYLARLRAGAHKLAILKQLRRSPEGRTFVPAVAGLDRAIKRHRLANLPLLGAFVRLMTGEQGNSATHRQLRVIENEIGRLWCGQSSLADTVRSVIANRSLLSMPTTIHEQSPPSPFSSHGMAVPANIDPGAIPIGLDSRERRALGLMRLFVRTKEATA